MRKVGWIWEKLPEVGVTARARLDGYREGVPVRDDGFVRYLQEAALVAARDGGFARALREALEELERRGGQHG